MEVWIRPHPGVTDRGSCGVVHFWAFHASLSLTIAPGSREKVSGRERDAGTDKQ